MPVVNQRAIDAQIKGGGSLADLIADLSSLPSGASVALVVRAGLESHEWSGTVIYADPEAPQVD